jgi:hypothetical protein
MSTAQQNPLFTRSEKGRFGRTMKKRVRGAARKGLSKIFGIPLSRGLGQPSAQSSRRGAHRSAKPSSGPGPSTPVRSDVIEALRGQGYNAATAKKMAEGVRPDDSFESAFRRVISRNPAELIIFGNPAHVYTRQGLIRAKRASNPIPAALVSAFESAAGSKLFDSVTSGKKKRNSHHGGTETRRKAGKKKNPDAETRATQLFEKFHHRGASGVFERQRSARQRKDYTILGPLVAIGINPEWFDKMTAKGIRVLGHKGWDDWAVEHYDEFPRLDFMTPGQVGQVKSILGDPAKYIQDCPLLASSPNGRQLYALAEDVGIDLSKFETDAGKDFVDLGDATFVVYIAKKPHEVREWVHMLGEHGGTRPRLMYDRLRKEVCFIGGSYVVKAPGIMH